MLAVDDPISFEAVSSACTDDLPDGDAALAWSKLESIYAKKSTTKKAELKTEFFASKPKTATSDPDAWFTKMELIKAKLKLDYGYVIEEEDYIEHILNSLPADYDATIESCNKDLNTIGFLELEEVKEQIRARHSRICKHKGIDPQTVDDEDTEKALTAKNYKKPFKGMCNTCGKQGHKSVDCWENERNKSKRPKNWKSSKAKGNDNNNNDSNKHKNKCQSREDLFLLQKERSCKGRLL